MTCTLKGTWYNELNSIMLITDVKEDKVYGKYHTAVGQAKGEYDLIGKINIDAETGHKQNTVGFVVTWNNNYGNSHSGSTWSGQYSCINEVETIKTTWLLTVEQSEKNEWASTQVGFDSFSKIKTSDEDVLLNIAKGIRPSHPFNIDHINDIEIVGENNLENPF
jgi:hypothetical protein